MANKPNNRADEQSILVRRVPNGKQYPTEDLRLEIILKMARQGCAVLPVVAGGKAPAVAGGVHAASKTLKMIEAYFSKNKTLNYGIAAGAASSIFVVDLDGLEGVKNWRRLKEHNGQCPPTVTVRTPNGFHLYYRAPEDRVGNSASKIAKSIDIRGDRGYVVGPGSETLDGVYRFAAGRSPDEVEFAEAPVWLLKMIARRETPAIEIAKPAEIPKNCRQLAVRYAEAARQRELERLGKAPKHQRNNTLNTCAFKLGQFLPYGLLDRRSVAEQLAQVASQIGLEARKIGPTIESGLTSGSRNPRQLSFLQNSARQPRVGAILETT